MQALKLFKSICQRNILLYLGVFLFLSTAINHERLKAKILNYLTQSIDYLVYWSEEREAFNHNKFHEYVHYYRTFAEYVPQASAAYGMLGFCYYHLGKEKEAITSYQKAIALQPQFFWFHYNLGLIYYQQKKYEQAADSFQKALAVNLKANLFLIRTSRIFSYIENEKEFKKFYRKENATIEEIIAHNLKQGYVDCQKLLVLALKRKQGGTTPEPPGVNFKLKVL